RGDGRDPRVRRHAARGPRAPGRRAHRGGRSGARRVHAPVTDASEGRVPYAGVSLRGGGPRMELVSFVDPDDLSPAMRTLWEQSPRPGLRKFAQVMAHAERFHLMFAELNAAI